MGTSNSSEMRRECVHVGALSVEVNRQNGAEFQWITLTQEVLNCFGIEVEGRGIDVEQDGSSTRAHDRAGRRKKTERGGDDGVAWLDPCGNKREPKCIGTRCTADGFCCARERRDFALKRFHFRAENKDLRGTDAFNRGEYVFADRCVLPPQIEHRNCLDWFRTGLDRRCHEKLQF